MSLRVLAVSAPEWPKRAAETTLGFNGSVPFSLQNAVRLAAGYADRKIGVWGESNWNTFSGRESSTLMLRHWEEERDALSQTLVELRPNLLLIGAMTLSLPGAIACANVAREMLGNSVAIVLGGKHANETVVEKKGNVSCVIDRSVWNKSDGIQKNETLFDAVISGEGEDVVQAIGNAVSHCLKQGAEPTRFLELGEHHLAAASGKWALVAPNGSSLNSVVSQKLALPWDEIPVAPELYAPGSPFGVFNDTHQTGHAYSDMGRGCAFDCEFCSERFAINGKLRNHQHGVERLIRHFSALSDQVALGSKTVSAFVEDSIFLAGQNSGMRAFATSLLDSGIKMPYGIQLTVDTILRPPVRRILADLKETGLRYVAFGMETISEDVASRMSKNTGRDSWFGRNLEAIRVLAGLQLDVGVFVLWGLGESRAERLVHLEELQTWQRRFNGQPSAVGLNWATRHPASEAGSEREPVRYDLWGTDPTDERLGMVQMLFGEASANLPYAAPLPCLFELQELFHAFQGLKLRN